ncbi:UNVERIFIED_CONTAM: hypothetical protein GTU68_050072 [Idotea baltica]|nr:hypothetical protein [Idotea baltica]
MGDYGSAHDCRPDGWIGKANWLLLSASQADILPLKMRSTIFLAIPSTMKHLCVNISTTLRNLVLAKILKVRVLLDPVL